MCSGDGWSTLRSVDKGFETRRRELHQEKPQ
jgi:hypothetical protein